MTENSIKEEVLKRIETGQVKIRSRGYFAFKSLLYALGFVLALLFAFYLISFVIFTLRASGAWFVTGFGFRGFGIVFTSLPKLIIVGVIAFIAVAELFARRFAFVYRTPLIYSALAIGTVTILGSLVFYDSRIHTSTYRFVNRQSPVLDKFWQDYVGMHSGINSGIVSKISTSSLSLETESGLIEYEITPETRMPRRRQIVRGDEIIVLQNATNEGGQRALGIRPIPKNRPEVGVRQYRNSGIMK